MPSLPPTGLPEPTPEAHTRSAELRERICNEIKLAGGAIPFARYMELALYTPGLGYYSGGQQKFGEHGDFVTAPELGPVFAQCLARQCAQILEHLDGGEMLEAGAGSGVLAADLLSELEQLGRLPAHYRILELSTELRARQSQTLGARVPHLVERVQWLDRLPEKHWRGIVLGNELLDAMPVERFRVTERGIAQLQVGFEDHGFVWREREASTALQQRIAPLNLPPGYASEAGLVAEAWVQSIAENLEQGVLLFMDYGFPRAEFYHPQRSGGTLMCHYRQRAHDNPFQLVGLQDITAHVDFTAMAVAGRAAGLDLLGYTSQAMFLLGCGLDEIAAPSESQNDRSRLALTAAIKKLTLPHEMGELFKVLALGRGFDTPLRGFALQDRGNRL